MPRRRKWEFWAFIHVFRIRYIDPSADRVFLKHFTYIQDITDEPSIKGFRSNLVLCR